MASLKKKIGIIAGLVVIFLVAGVVYLNKVFLPTKAKSLLIQSLQTATGKRVTVDSLEINLFKGLVARGLVISDATRTQLSVKEVSCTFLFLPLLVKQFIVPTFIIDSPSAFLQRRVDGSWNIEELFTMPVAQGQKYNVIIYNARVRNGSLHVQDDAVTPAFSNEMKNIEIASRFQLGGKIRFRARSEITTPHPVKVDVQGTYSLASGTVASKMQLQGVAPQEFSSYYQKSGVALAGLIDAAADCYYHDGVIDASVFEQSREVVISKEKITAVVSSQIDAHIKYDVKKKQGSFSGAGKVFDSRITGVEKVGDITSLAAEVRFDAEGISAEKINGVIWGVPFEGSARLSDYKSPSLRCELFAGIDLTNAQALLKEKLVVNFTPKLEGKGVLSLRIGSRFDKEALPEIEGVLEAINAKLSPDGFAHPLENINGKFKFDLNQLMWNDVVFKYQGVEYSSDGTLTNFQAPGIRARLSSKDLLLEALLAVNNKIIKISDCKGTYYRSTFSFDGEIDTTNTSHAVVQLQGGGSLNLEDLKEMFKKQAGELKKINPSGFISIKAHFQGDVTDFKNCVAEVTGTGGSVSFYGLKATDVAFSQTLRDGVLGLESAHLSLYDGTVDAQAAANLTSENIPYWIAATIDGVKIEKLKEDTPEKGKDMAGSIRAEAKLNGFGSDLSRLQGAGRIMIADGNLWQLNLFKGLGAVLFPADFFTKIIFSEGSCNFIVQDKFVTTNNLLLKSNVSEMTGSLKLGFDLSVDAALDVYVMDEMVPLTGTFRDVTTAIVGQGGRFGVIKISGTLQEPKYKFKPAIADIFKGIKDVFIKNRAQ